MSWYPAIWYIWLLLIIVGFFFRKEAELGINTASVGFIMVLTAAGGATSFAQSLLRTLHLNHIFKGEGQAIVFGGVLLILYFVGNFIYKKNTIPYDYGRSAQRDPLRISGECCLGSLLFVVDGRNRPADYDSYQPF